MPTRKVIIDGNEALQRLTGFTLPEVLNQSIFSFITPEWRSVALEYTRSGREDPYEVTITHKDGHTIPVEAVGKTMPLQHADYRIVVLHDLTARMKAKEREAFIALHDPLTNLPNRHHLMEQLDLLLAQANRRQGRAAVLFIDLDHFKTINDSLGHHAGDQFVIIIGLCDVIIRAHFQSAHDIAHFAERRQEDNRHVRHLPQPFAYFPTAHIGNHNIQQHHIRLVTIGFPQSFVRALRLDHFKAPALQ